MLAEHFMDNGADYSARLGEWEKPGSWEWENVVMLSRKPHGATGTTDVWGADDPPLLVAPSHRNSTVPDHALKSSGAGLLLPPPIVIKHELQQGADGVASNMSARSDEVVVMNKVADNVNNNVNVGMNSSSSATSSKDSRDFHLGLAPAAQTQGVDAKMNTSNKGTSPDAETGLKLGLKRSFCGTPPDAAAAAGAAVVSNNGGTKPGTSPGKRPRGSAHHTPRCQVEGCRTDLSSAKDYHRRHKVCAMHSKSAKVSVNSIEQRFCQQCSRFHVLTEFDEGKRSCRRRLAGHNERRRKPQPDPMQLTTALAPYQAGFMRLTRDDRIFGYGTPLSYLGLENLHGKFSWPRLGSVDDSSQTGLVSAGSSSLSTRCPDRFFMLFPQRKGPILNGFVGHQFITGSSTMGHNLTLSSSTSASPVYAGLPPNQGVASDSGRALSLLSSQPWGTAAATTTHDHSMDQVLMSDGTKRYSVSVNSNLQQPAFNTSASSSPPGRGYGVNVPLDGPQGGGQGSYHLPGLGNVNNYENNSSVLTLLQENDFQQPQHSTSRPTIDLMMQMSSQPMQQQQQQAQQQPEFQVLKPAYGPTASIYDPRHL